MPPTFVACVLKSAYPRKLFVLLLVLFATVQVNLSKSTDTMADSNLALREEFSKNLALFAVNMYSKLLLLKPNENIVFSPFSIQTCAAMARIGAEGETAAELDRGLGLASSDVNAMADTFHQVLATYENSSILKIANRIYVMKGHSVRAEFNEIVSKKFYSSADEIDFAKSAEAAKTMNAWVESKTNNLIKDLIGADSLSSDTRLILLNAIHFKGEWKHKFNKQATHDDDFYLNESDKVKVPMMNLKERFRYAELPDLEATALEMPYKDSDLSMLVILPNSRTGLKNLEDKLKNVALSDITKRMRSMEVIVKFPRFKAEFSVELNEPFKQLGMSRMFSNHAEFGKMLSSGEELKVSKVIHKAFIEVNEEGTEAAAATAMKLRKKRAIINLNEFIAEHPFLYVIVNQVVPPDSEAAELGEVLPLFMGALVNALGAASDSVSHDEL